MELSVVVPVLNEAGNIEPLLQEIHAVLEGKADFEVVYVDDGSTDVTPRELEVAKSRYPRLCVITHRQRYGQSMALRSGIKVAQGKWIATLDGDGQNDPGDIPRLLEIARGAMSRGTTILVAGYRRKRQDSWIRRLSSRVANGVRSRLLGDATPDSACGLKVFARDIYLDMPYFDHMHRFFPALTQRVGGTVISAEVNHRSRRRGCSKYGTIDRLFVGIVDLFGVMWLQRRATRPTYCRKGDALE